MAAAKKSSGSRAGASAKTRKKPAAREVSAGRRQLWSVVWFAVAVFLLCVVFIPGQNVWRAVHNAIFGIFGVTAYFYPFLLGAVAILVAADKT